MVMPCASPCRWTRSRAINIAGDSTFALMLKAQERGHQLYHYLAEDLT